VPVLEVELIVPQLPLGVQVLLESVQETVPPVQVVEELELELIVPQELDGVQELLLSVQDTVPPVQVVVLLVV
jgi:hypothetical protein